MAKLPRVGETTPKRIRKGSRVRLRGCGHAGKTGTAEAVSANGWWVRLDESGRRINVAVRFLECLDGQVAA